MTNCPTGDGEGNDLSAKKEWDHIYGGDSLRNKNKYPSTEVVSFMLRRYGGCNDMQNIRVLDLGCGWGNNLGFLANEGFDAFGIDISFAAVKNSRNFIENVLVGPLDALPYREEVFDVAIDRMAIQHNEKPAMGAAFAEARRVLKSGGILFSVVACSGKFNTQPTLSDEKDIRRWTRDYSTVSIDYQETSHDNKSRLQRVYFVIAQK